MRRSPRPTSPAFSRDDPRVVLRALLRRARLQLLDDVNHGRLTAEQARQLFDATSRSYAKRLGLLDQMQGRRGEDVSDSGTLAVTRRGDG
jgi:hypothetical protein